MIVPRIEFLQKERTDRDDTRDGGISAHASIAVAHMMADNLRGKNPEEEKALEECKDLLEDAAERMRRFVRLRERRPGGI